MAGLFMNSLCFIALLSHLCALTAFGQNSDDDDGYFYYDYVIETTPVDTDLSLDDWLHEILDFTNPCASNPCMNGGSCAQNASGDFKCLCPEPYAGIWCQNVKDVCKNVKCGNGDCLLTSTAPFYRCKCRAPFQPPDCKKAAPCRPNPCQNGGSCTVGAKRSSFQCACPDGYSGKSCDVGPNDCYQGDGELYRGMVSETAEGEACLNWDAFFIVQKGQNPFITYAGYDGIGQHNYCRNPDGDDKPWCFINKNGTLEWNYCEVRKCTAAPTAPPTTDQTNPPEVTPVSQFSQCGKPQPGRSSRIFGGKKSVPGAHPWQVSVQNRTKGSSGPFGHLCGGILLGSCWVLTAAHCILSDMEMQVVVGGVNIEKLEESDQVIPVVRAIVHENYRDSVYSNDVAMLQLQVTQSPYCARETRFVKTACLPNQPFSSGSECVISGWGATETKRYGTKNLLDTRVLLIPQEKCKAPHVYGDSLDESMFCAGYMRGGTDSCQGDSGGPLVCERNGTHHIVGVVSWGEGCGEKYKPGVYANVGKFVDWIADYLQ